jgi:tetratricopeptide (TPR) repeat protein
VRLHPLVRELAREEFAAEDEPDQRAVVEALLAGVQDWVSQHRQPNVTNFRVLAQDVDLIAGALRAATARHVTPSQVVSIVDAWGANIPVYALSVEMRTLQLDGARMLGDRAAETTALYVLGIDSGYMGRGDDAIRYGQEALVVARTVGDPIQMIRIVSFLGDRLHVTGEREAVEQLYQEATSIARELGDRLTDERTLNHLGGIASAAGHNEEAGQWFQRALERTRAEGNHIGEMLMLYNLGTLHDEMGDPGAARQFFNEALSIARQFGDPRLTGVTLNGLGQVALKAADLEQAERDLTEALPYLEQADQVANILQVRGNLQLLAGLKAERQGEQAAATRAFEEALHLLDEAYEGGTNAAENRPFARQLLANPRSRPAEAAPLPVARPAADDDDLTRT